jgi:hypothetical protein
MQEKLIFGQVPAAQPQTPTCAFQVMIIDRNGRVKSARCQEKPIINDWCLCHQHAQAGMDLGAALDYPEIAVPLVDNEPCKIILGQGRENWQAYFERARDPGLATVMAYLEKIRAEREK